ncbi:MAG TPA: LUD domain-containing protein [Anaerolineales bacterium]|nr:LUD domain-containing protein [Anaerolineales bacterium]
MTVEFRRRVRRAVQDSSLQSALDRNADRRVLGAREAYASLPDLAVARREARAVRRETLDDLDMLLQTFIHNLELNGIQVLRAANAYEAVEHVVAIARSEGAEIVAKSKSMVSEEIDLNRALDEAGIRSVETDLGEFIVQIRRERPAHIITPAVHLRREDVAETFHEHFDMEYTTDVQAMTAVARRILRRVFHSAQVGVSGVNFGVAETGTLCLVTNEGNGRMVTTLPPVHVALMGIERLIPSLEDLAPMLALLPRAATGQKITSYVSLLQRPRQPHDPDGPRARYVILVDDGRSQLRASDLADSLLCIRCGACLNICPVYREAGGHAYGSVYPGPIGSVVSPGLFGLKAYGHLAKASTLCGACKDACPVDIDLPSLLLRVRARFSPGLPPTSWMRMGIRLFAWAMADPIRYRISQRLARLGVSLLPRRLGWVRWLPPPLSAWTGARDFPPFARRMLRDRDLEFGPIAPTAPPRRGVESATENPLATASVPADPVLRFEQELEVLGGTFIRCATAQLPEAVADVFRLHKISKAIAWRDPAEVMNVVRRRLEQDGIELVDGRIDGGEQRNADLEILDGIEAGLTGAQAGLADTGTVILPSGEGKPMAASLLPWVHICLLSASRLFPDLKAWLTGEGREQIDGASSIVLISGPSRTADIEMTLTRGVHGPGEVIVVCYD